MATLKVVFKAIDEISSKFNEMTQSGERALEAFENTGTAADGALSKVSRTAAQTAKSTDAAADSVDDLSSAIGDYERPPGRRQILPASCPRKRPRPRRTSTRQRRQPVKPRRRSRSSVISPRKLASRARNRAKGPRRHQGAARRPCVGRNSRHSERD